MDEGKKHEKLGYASLKSNNIKEAESHFLKAVELMQSCGDEAGQAYMLGNLGNIYFQGKQLEQAEGYYSQSLALMEKVKDVKGIESSLGNLGSVHFYKGSLDKAEENYQKALKIMEEANDKSGQGIYNGYIGNVLLGREEFDAAEDYYQRAITFLDKEKDAAQISQLEEKIASIEKHPGYLKKKEEAILASIEKLSPKGQESDLLAKYQELEEVYYQGSRMDQVAEVIEKSISLYEALNDKQSAGICHGNLASVLFQLGVSGQEDKIAAAEMRITR